MIVWLMLLRCSLWMEYNRLLRIKRRSKPNTNGHPMHVRYSCHVSWMVERTISNRDEILKGGGVGMNIFGLNLNSFACGFREDFSEENEPTDELRDNPRPVELEVAPT